MKWKMIVRMDGRIGWQCEHNIGHDGPGHGCDFCCERDDFPPKLLAKPGSDDKVQLACSGCGSIDAEGGEGILTETGIFEMHCACGTITKFDTKWHRP